VRRVLRPSERSILSELRRFGAMSKPDLAKRIALTPQAVNGIVDDLVRDGLTQQGGQRGGVVGHPSTLYTLSPQGGFSIGLKLSQQGLEALLVDFVGTAIYRATTEGPCIDIAMVDSMIRSGYGAVRKYAQTSAIDFDRIFGIGLAIPGDVFYVRPDLRSAVEEAAYDLAKDANLSVVITDHGAAAATAELMIGAAEGPPSFLCISVGQTIESALVLNGTLCEDGQVGSHRIAHAPVCLTSQMRGTVPLKDIASIERLYEDLRAAGFHARSGNVIFEAMHEYGDIVDLWVKTAAKAISFVALSAQALINLDTLLLHSELPSQLQISLIDNVRRELSLSSASGTIGTPRVEAARLGASAIALGAAVLPIYRQVWPSRMSAAAVGNARSLQ
jgi:predicted NBD/HSP70 family sugar kinase